MAGIIAFPHVVRQALQDFGELFANELQRRHFAEYLTGLYVADRKTVSGINAQFANSRDPSCLNRFLRLDTWDVQALNQRRLDLLQQHSETRYSEHGTIAMDSTSIDHTGKLINDVGWLWDYAELRHKIAHDYSIANYVYSSGKAYPLEFRCFQKQEQRWVQQNGRMTSGIRRGWLSLLPPELPSMLKIMTRETCVFGRNESRMLPL